MAALVSGNYYQLLELDNSASAEEIRKAYLKLAKKYHPDLHRQNKVFEEKFKEIQQAYQVLSNPFTKNNYDYQQLYKNKTPSPIRTPTVNWAEIYRQQEEMKKRKEEAIREENRINMQANLISLGIVGAVVVLILAVSFINIGSSRWISITLILLLLFYGLKDEISREIKRWGR